MKLLAQFKSMTVDPVTKKFHHARFELRGQHISGNLDLHYTSELVAIDTEMVAEINFPHVESQLDVIDEAEIEEAAINSLQIVEAYLEDNNLTTVDEDDLEDLRIAHSNQETEIGALVAANKELETQVAALKAALADANAKPDDENTEKVTEEAPPAPPASNKGGKAGKQTEAK